MSTNLIDTYVSEVGRRLPRKTRTDIEAEIHSILQDMLEERSRMAGIPADDEMILEVLKSYGDPEKVASTYMGERYLIGPQLYPIFKLVLSIVLLVYGILAAIGLGVLVFQPSLTPLNSIETIIKGIANFCNSFIIALGNIVLIFALIERALYRTGEKVEVKNLAIKKEWDPRSLIKISPQREIKIGETIVEIVGCFAAIVIFNFYPQVIGFIPSLNSAAENGSWPSVTFIPLLSDAFFHYVPYLTLIWATTIILNFVLLRMGHWTASTRVFTIGLKVINIFIAGAMLAGPSLIATNTSALTAALGNPEGTQILMTMITQGVRVALWVAVIGGCIDVVRAIYQTVTSSK
jgi:hypothetical protein